MKNRNLILTAVVMFCALGSAVAAKLFVVNPVWISGVTLAGVATCSTVTTDCDNSGARACEVRIQISNGTTPSTNGFTANVCQIRATQNSVTAIKPKPGLLSVTPYTP